jgi:hypothetical protein
MQARVSRSALESCVGVEGPAVGEVVELESACGDRYQSGSGAVCVNEPTEHVDPFDAPDVFDICGCRFRRRYGYVKADAAVRPGAVPPGSPSTADP